MIQTKEDLREYLRADQYALGMKGQKPKHRDVIWRYEILLRKAEYHKNNAGKRHYLLYRWYRHFQSSLGVRLGYSIPPNVFGKGLNIAHIGTIVVNSFARVGDFCRVHQGVTLGTSAGANDLAPTIGNSCFIGPGAALFGKIVLADDIAVGANAVVNKSFTTPRVAIAGAPAKVINDKGSIGLLYTEYGEGAAHPPRPTIRSKA